MTHLARAPLRPRLRQAVQPSGSLQHTGGVGGAGYVRPKKDALDDAPHRRWEKGGGGRGGHRLRGGQVLTGAERVETLSHFCKELTRACDDDNLELAFEVLDKVMRASSGTCACRAKLLLCCFA